jgi:hypothetical protein
VPTLHLHIVDEANIHIPKASVTVKGVAGASTIDFAGSSKSKGTVSVDLGALTTGAVVLGVDVDKDGKTAQLSITDTVAPLVRPDISYTIEVAGAKGSKVAQLLAEMEALVGESGGPLLVGGAAVVGLGIYFANERKKAREQQQQAMMMMMAMSRAPAEVATATLATGIKTAKKAAVAAARPMKVLKATFKKVGKK